MSLIEDYVDYASNSTDAPLIYHRAVAYHVISSILGRYVKIVTSYAPRGLMPNIWVVLIGPSRITRKTTAMSLGTSIIKEVDEKLVIPASFTPEALYELLDGMQSGDAVVWIKDELGGFFKMLEKRYMAGIREILSSIYMGYGETRKLRNLTLKIPDGIYVTAIGTMPTPPHYYLHEEDFTSGFLNRWILAYAIEREKRIPILHIDKTLDEKRRSIIERLKEFDNFYRSIAPVVVTFSSDAIKILEEYDLNTERELVRIESENPTSLFKLYLAESPNLFLKLVVLRRLAREPLSQVLTVVERQDCVKARDDMELFLRSAREVIEDVQTSATAKPVLTEEKALSRIYSIIKEKGPKGVTFTELLRSTSMLKSSLVEYLITLMEQGKIVCVKAQTERGRRPLMFFSSEYMVVAQREGLVLDPDTVQVMLSK